MAKAVEPDKIGMKVNDLIKKLLTVPGDMRVMVSADPEGNHHSPLYEMTRQNFRKTGPLGWLLVDETGKGIEEAVVLWPL